jgi:hypothetical protein
MMGFFATFLTTTSSSSSDDPFEAVSDFFSSGVWSVIQLVIQAFVVLMWLALIYWTYQDARRRIREPALIAGSVALSVLIPYLGSLIYLVVRPPEYLIEARERELELIELERRMGELGDSEGQALVGRILERERGGDPDDPAVRSELKKAGLATREELQDIDLRLTELEFRFGNSNDFAAGAKVTGPPADSTAPTPVITDDDEPPSRSRVDDEPPSRSRVRRRPKSKEREDG